MKLNIHKKYGGETRVVRKFLFFPFRKDYDTVLWLEWIVITKEWWGDWFIRDVQREVK